MATADTGLMGMMGDPQGGQPSGGTTENVADVGTQNPSQAVPGDEYFSLQGVDPADLKKMVGIISDYRGDWMQDRLERGRQWMQNLFYWKGIQVIGWDNSSSCWYDALAWSRSQNQESGEDTDLERWINPLTLMFCNTFTSTMSRVTPKPVVKPRDADPNLQDTVTAKAAQEALNIIGRQNRIRTMNRSFYEMLFLFGCYFRHTRPVIDGEFGYDEKPIFEDMQIEVGPHYRCPNCGTETPATTPQGMNCPACGSFMGQESYYAAGEGNRMSLRQAGVKKVPRAGVKQSLHSPLEIDVDPKAKGDFPLKKTPILVKECEIDFGEACMMFPAFAERIQPGAESSTTPNASVERLYRLNAVSVLNGTTADNALMNPTYSETWVKPAAYFRTRDMAFAQRMREKFPEGLKITMIGDLIVDIRAAVLEKEWSHCALYANQGVYCNALANVAVSFNARFNRVMWILDDWAARAATGLNVVDASRLDSEKLSGKKTPAGTLVPIPMKIDGDRLPMEQSFMHFDLPINPALWNYPMMLMTFCELIIGIPRQIAGQGTQEDVETLGGQQLQLARAATTLKPYFENVKDEDAQASQNAIECLQTLMKTGACQKISEVIKGNGGAYENNEVEWSEMQGQVNIEADEDQDLPIDPAELRVAIQTMFKELTAGNPAAIAWFDVPENQEIAQSSMVPGSVVPDEAQRLKTENDIQTIIDKGGQPKLNQDGTIGVDLPAHPEKHENFPIAKQVLQRYMLKNFQLRTEKADRWILLTMYWDELDSLDMQVAAKAANKQMQVAQAGAPPKPQPDPGTVAAVQELQKLAVQMADQLARISMIDPMITKQTATAQVTAAQDVIKDALDATKAMHGDK